MGEPKFIIVILYTTAQCKRDSTMNFKTYIPTLIYILRMTGLFHHVFINKKTPECKNIKLRK